MINIEVNIQLLDAINWRQEAECDFKLNDTIDVWRVHIPSYQNKIPQFLSILQPDEIARANRYRHEKDRTRFIVSRAILRQIVSKYINQPASLISFSIDPNKKPYISGTNVQYNVSHSANWALIAIAKTALGVDTETIDTAFNFQSILDDNFSSAEIAFIGKSPENFFLLWTRKESLTKATGQGLDDNLKFLPCLDGLHMPDNNVLLTKNNCQISSFKLDNANWGSVVSEKGNDLLRFFDTDV